MPIMRRVFLEHGSVILDVEKDTLTVRMLNGLGVIRDRFQIVKKGEVAREVVLHPWSGLGPKIGALGSDDVVRNVTLGLGDLAREVPVVLDPILFSSSGAPLLERRAWAALQALCGTCELVTPNLPEAEALSGRDVSRRAGVEDAARFFVEDLGAGAVLVKGGHQSEAGVADLLAVPDAQGALDFHWLESERIEIESVHGTGCALSSAITAHLAMGASLPEAVASARAFVAAAIEAARRPGDGAHFLVYS